MSRGVKGLLVVALLGMGEMLLTSCVGVVNQPPVAVLKANPTSGDVPLEVTFDISGSYDPDGGGGTALDWIERPSPEVAGKAGSTGSIVQFSLDFGDGTPAVTGSNIDQPIRHVYRTDGIYSAILTVTDLAQASSTASLQISAYLHSAALLMGPSGGEIELDDGTKLVIEAGFFKSQTDVFFANWSHPAVLPASLSPITLTAEVRFPKEALTGAAEEQLLSIQIPTSAHTDEDYDVAALLFNTGSFRLELFGRYLETADHALIQIPAAIFDEVRDEVRQDIIAMQTLITNVKNYFNIGQHLYRASQDSGGGVALEEITSRVDLEGKTPLILVHGWDAILGDISTDPKKRVISVWGKFLSYILADPLIKDRYQVFAFRYDSDHKITENGKGLSDKVNLAFGTAQNVVILAHSMGGLVARSYMLEHGGEQRVRKLITLGTPNHGSPLANPEIHGISPRCVYGDAFYLTRSDGAQDLRWDDFDGLSGKYPVLLKNEWLSDLNAMPQDNSKIVAYGGIITSLNHRLAYQIGFNCLSGRLGYLLNDGIVPLTSAYYEPHLSSTQERDEQDYDHSQLLGRSNSDPIFTQIRNELLALYPPAPPEMVLIPAGSFEMGDSFNEGGSDERPVHTVYVSAFYMDKYEVTNLLWNEVARWANDHGYNISRSADGKGPDYPVDSVTWYEAVKWANARSEKEGLTPCYYSDSTQETVYRTGIVDVQNDWVKWSGCGYRLPTEAEWEKAARGGCEGHRFPWCDTDTIQHARANYCSHCWGATETYDTSPTQGYHPDYDDAPMPYTSPVGSFAPNGYGLYDMAGNVWEWVWDRFVFGGGYYSSSPGSDPRGPTSGEGRAARGGSWGDNADFCRVSERMAFFPGSSLRIGFRLVRTAP